MSKTATEPTEQKHDLEAPPPYEQQPKYVADMSREPLITGIVGIPGSLESQAPSTFKGGIFDCGGNLGTCKSLII
jgi:hypothetical protein